MYTNTSCTLYLASNNYEAIIIPHCFLTHRKIYATSKLGLEYNESAFCMIQGNSSLSFSEGKDFLVDGVCDFTFDNSSEKGYSDSVKALKALDAYTVMIADWKNYGSKHMRHWEISCK